MMGLIRKCFLSNFFPRKSILILCFMNYNIFDAEEPSYKPLFGFRNRHRHLLSVFISVLGMQLTADSGTRGWCSCIDLSLGHPRAWGGEAALSSSSRRA